MVLGKQVEVHHWSYAFDAIALEFHQMFSDYIQDEVLVDFRTEGTLLRLPFLEMQSSCHLLGRSRNRRAEDDKEQVGDFRYCDVHSN
jgi:hypothetical protein